MRLLHRRLKSIRLDVSVSGTGTLTTLANANTAIVNTISAPDNIKPETQTIAVKGREIKFTAAPYSLSVLKVKLN